MDFLGGPLWGPLGVPWEFLGGPSGVPCGPLYLAWGTLGIPWSPSDLPWGSLGVPWTSLRSPGGPWGHPGVPLALALGSPPRSTLRPPRGPGWICDQFGVVPGSRKGARVLEGGRSLLDPFWDLDWCSRREAMRFGSKWVHNGGRFFAFS